MTPAEIDAAVHDDALFRRAHPPAEEPPVAVGRDDLGVCVVLADGRTIYRDPFVGDVEPVDVDTRGWRSWSDPWGTTWTWRQP